MKIKVDSVFFKFLLCIWNGTEFTVVNDMIKFIFLMVILYINDII